jgi:type III secretion protein U
VKEETEEKTLPATPKKLRDARRKGQVPHSKDLVAGAGLVAAVVYLLHARSIIEARVTSLVDLVAAAIDQPFTETWQRLVPLAVQVLVLTSVPLAALVFAISAIAGMAGTLGPVFAFENASLKFEHIDPVQGAKRIFSARNLIEFAKAVAKVVVLIAAFWLTLRTLVQSLFETPACGGTCLGPMTIATMKPLAITAAIAFAAIGLIDVLLQYRLYLRDMRMTHTERKRELKDLEGDPLIRSERRRVRRQAATGPVRIGVRHAVVIIAHGDRAVGLRYNAADTPVPTVVSRGRGAAAAQMLTEARRRGIPIVEDSALVGSLIRGHAIGDRIRQQLFNAVARILFRLGL